MVGCKAPNGAQPGAKGETPQKAQAQWEAPPNQKGNDLNLIVLVSDSFRADNLAAYGSTWVDTPNLNDFAKESIVFDSYYPEGLPTIPLRRQLYTGRRIFPTHLYFQQDSVKLAGWHELFLEDVTLAETLLAAGYQTALIADLPHLFKPGRNFQRASTTSSGCADRKSITARKRRAQPRTSVLYIPRTTCNWWVLPQVGGEKALPTF
jgi:hypothetical protein